MHTILISGGTGLVGKALTKALLEKGHRVIILSRQRHTAPAIPGVRYAPWNPQEGTIDASAIAEADYIIHLAGAGVADKRWTKKRKKEILDSRVEGSKLLVSSLSTIPNKVKAVVSASAIGWYGADPAVPNPRPFTEGDPPDPSFLGTTCRQWEESINPVTKLGIRLVKLRIGIVLSPDGGAMKEFIKPLRFGIAAVLGNGKQVISWIHLSDLVQLFIRALENETMLGVYNAVAPQPVSNRELVLRLAKSRKKFFLPVRVPAFVLRLVLGEMSIEVLKSCTVSSNRLLQEGFVYRYPSIREACESF